MVKSTARRTRFAAVVLESDETCSQSWWVCRRSVKRRCLPCWARCCGWATSSLTRCTGITSPPPWLRMTTRCWAWSLDTLFKDLSELMASSMSPSEAVRMMLTDGQLDEGMTLEEGVGFKNYHRVTTLIQKNVRRLYQQRWYVEVRRLWILVQAAARRFVYTTRYRRMRRSAVKIQTMWRCWYLFHGYQKHLRQVHKPFIMSKWKKFKHNVLGVSNAKREVPVHPYFRLI